MARESKTAPKGVRRWIWLGLAALLVLGASTAVAAIKVCQYATRSSRFTVSRSRPDALSIEGLKYASRQKVQSVFDEDFGHSVFSAPLEERRRRLLALDWVEDAAVSRVWPDRLAVRIRERQPLAFVLLQSAVLLIDRDGMFLEPPSQAQFSFPVLGGVLGDEPREQRVERVNALLRVESDLGYLMKDVSEVNVSDIDNIRIDTEVENQPVELIVGNAAYGRRYRNFLDHYAEIHKRSPEVKVFDLRLDDRITARGQE